MFLFWSQTIWYSQTVWIALFARNNWMNELDCSRRHDFWIQKYSKVIHDARRCYACIDSTKCRFVCFLKWIILEFFRIYLPGLKTQRNLWIAEFVQIFFDWVLQLAIKTTTNKIVCFKWNWEKIHFVLWTPGCRQLIDKIGGTQPIGTDVISKPNFKQWLISNFAATQRLCVTILFFFCALCAVVCFNKNNRDTNAIFVSQKRSQYLIIPWKVLYTYNNRQPFNKQQFRAVHCKLYRFYFLLFFRPVSFYIQKTICVVRKKTTTIISMVAVTFPSLYRPVY